MMGFTLSGRAFVQFFLQSNPLKKSLHTMKPLYPL
jgi:hypothetical protein